VTLDTIGPKYLIIRSEPYKLAIDHSYNTLSQCQRCQLFSPPTAICTPQHPIACVVCAQEHLKTDHPCKYPNCLVEPRCHYLQIKCAPARICTRLRPEFPSESQGYRASQTSMNIWTKYGPSRAPHAQTCQQPLINRGSTHTFEDKIIRSAR
jgi:hypothetical protein